MRINKSKQAKKYLQSLDSSTREKLNTAIDRLREGKGDIIKLRGKNMYRLKVPPFRIGFSLDYENSAIEIVLIRPRGDFYKHI